MAEAPFLPAAVERRAAADPESPFIFWPEGWNWRWWSWRQTADLMARWAAPLAGLPPGAAVGFDGRAYPQALALDLAVQAARWVPVPAGGLTSGCAWWLDLPAGPSGAARLRSLEGCAPSSDGDGGASPPAAGVMVQAAEEWHLISVPELEGAVARVGEMIRAGRAATGERDILVAGRQLGSWGGRLLAAWATVEGAALVVDADPASRLGNVLWARPTVFGGNASELAALRGQIEAARRSGGWRRLMRQRLPRRAAAPERRPRPVGRLRVLFQDEPLDAEAVAFWQVRNARLLQIPGRPRLGEGGPPSTGAAGVGQL
jgi:hypothetical protein